MDEGDIITALGVYAESTLGFTPCSGSRGRRRNRVAAQMDYPYRWSEDRRDVARAVPVSSTSTEQVYLCGDVVTAGEGITAAPVQLRLFQVLAGTALALGL